MVPSGLHPVNGEWGSMPLVKAGSSSDNNVIMTNDFNFKLNSRLFVMQLAL